MATKRRKSLARSWQQKSPDRNARSAAGSGEGTVKSDIRASAHRSALHRVHFEQLEHSRNSVSECGDCPRVSQRILLNAIKNMGEKLENIIDILTPRSLKAEWPTGINEGDLNVMADLQHQLDAGKDDNSKAIAMLEHVLASHNNMQAALAMVQTELGHKDTEISNLRKDKSQAQQKIQRLETELEHCRAKLVAMGRQHSSQVEPLCKMLESARTDNKKPVLHLEEVLQVNNTLQSKLVQTQYELKSKETERQQLIVCREQLTEKAKTEEKMYAEQLESLKKQFQTEQEASRKAACQECAEIKKSLEGSSSKLAEVSRANRELRQKLTELEESLSGYKEQLKSQRARIRQCLMCNITTERIKETESELRKMEAIKDKYQKKNYEQSQDIKKFVSELKSVQSEMQVLLKNQHEMQVQNRQLETQVEAERRQRQQLENKCQELEKTVKHLKKYKVETEQKLKEASIESKQITTSLEEAHRWFKYKFDSLQPELVKNHQPKNHEENSSKKEAKKASTFISKKEAKKIGAKATRASHSHLPGQQGKDPRPPAHHQEGPRELGRK
uniref:Coiled-coil domain-containing protein 150 n=1 Tax=Accipiter nisus TaxID=211598 RepID=A0A8B9M4T1_9AVES